MKHILKCTKCGVYTMKEKCECGERAVSPKPVKYSADDKFGKYRRIAKKRQ